MIDCKRILTFLCGLLPHDWVLLCDQTWPVELHQGLGWLVTHFLVQKTSSLFSVFSVTPLRFATSLSSHHLLLLLCGCPASPIRSMLTIPSTVSPLHQKVQRCKHPLVSQLLYFCTCQGTVPLRLKMLSLFFVFVL